MDRKIIKQFLLLHICTTTLSENDFVFYCTEGQECESKVHIAPTPEKHIHS